MADVSPAPHARPPEKATPPEGLKYGRILLKLSGEALQGDQGYGIDPEVLGHIGEEVKAAHDLGLEDGRIGPHERIQPQRAGHLADHLSRVAVHSSPVAFGYQGDPRVDEIVTAATAGEPDLVIERGDGLHQTIWTIPDEHLETLDFFDVNNASNFPFAEVLAQRESLEHLRRLHLPGHLVPESTRKHFADWPEARFLSFERVEALGYDLWAIGYPKALR